MAPNHILRSVLCHRALTVFLLPIPPEDHAYPIPPFWEPDGLSSSDSGESYL